MDKLQYSKKTEIEECTLYNAKFRLRRLWYVEAKNNGHKTKTKR